MSEEDEFYDGFEPKTLKVTQPTMPNITAITPKGICIVCGSGLLLQFWRGHPDNQKVHCNDCGSEVTVWMHEKRQPNI
jgi:hypothetical protein